MGEYSNNGDITDDQRDAIILAGAFQAASVRTFYYPGRSENSCRFGSQGVFLCQPNLYCVLPSFGLTPCALV